jgi:hypothetical protein
MQKASVRSARNPLQWIRAEQKDASGIEHAQFAHQAINRLFDFHHDLGLRTHISERIGKQGIHQKEPE